MPKTGVMVCGHGSRDADAVQEFLSLAEGLRPRLPDSDLEIGFLDFARPVIREGLEDGESYIVEGVLRARPGLPVTPGSAPAAGG